MKYAIIDGLLRLGYKLTKFQPRPMIKFCRDYFEGEKVNGMEIGVWHGDNAMEILTALNVNNLYLIDPYEVYEDTKEVITEHILSKAKRTAEKRVKGIWIDRETPTEMLDFVYIDANHSYKEVKKDIDFALTKLKKGGVIGGHDYSLDYPGVVKAVKQFRQDHFAKNNDWWAIV